MKMICKCKPIEEYLGEDELGYSRKDYIEFAKMLRYLPDPVEKRRLVDEIADIFRRDNPRFDYTKFYDAVFK